MLLGDQIRVIGHQSVHPAVNLHRGSSDIKTHIGTHKVDWIQSFFFSLEQHTVLRS